MDIELITLLSVALFVLLLMLGVPFAFAMGGIAVLLVLILWGPARLPIIASRVFTIMLNDTLVAIPMFIFMASILERSGIVSDAYEAAHVWMGPLKGGLAIATIVICTIMAAMVGVIGASVTSMGLIALPNMLRRGYDKKLTLGTICAGGSLGTLIPPSVVFIVYGMIAGESVGKLFMSGIVPGLLLSALFIGYISIRCYLNPSLGPALPAEERMLRLREKLSHLKSLIFPFILIICVLGSIFFGIATPVEASGVGCAGAIVCAAINRRLSWRMIAGSLYPTLSISCMVLWCMFGASAFIGVYSLAGGNQFMEKFIVGLQLTPWGIIIASQILFLFMGCLVDWLAILMLAGPILFPIVRGLGFDMVWFGTIFVMNIQLSYLTPPVGPALFYLKGVAPPEVTMRDIWKSVPPFLLLQALGLILVLLIPDIALWLPKKMIK